MQIKIVRLDARRSESFATRDDRVVVHVPGYGPAVPLPHDLAHFVIEKELGLHKGFWGSVAGGAKFPGMSVVSGRQRPHAEARSAALCKANARRVTEVEVVISVLLQLMREGTAPTSRRAASLLAERWQPKKESEIAGLGPPDMANLCERLQAMAQRWSQVGIGSDLVVRW
jgi:hypothetical protein